MTTSAARLRLPQPNSFVWPFLAALLLRACYLFEAFRNNELIAYPLVDEEVYVQWAREIVGGQWLWSQPINYTPGYPLWLACWIAVFGWQPVAHFAVFLFLGAAQAAIIGRTAELLWDLSLIHI